MPTRTDIARIVDAEAFSNWDGLFDYCVNHGDEPAVAEKCADQFYGPRCAAALAKADSILALTNGERDNA